MLIVWCDLLLRAGSGIAASHVVVLFFAQPCDLTTPCQTGGPSHRPN